MSDIPGQSPRTFTKDWFNRTEHCWERLAGSAPIARALEIGSYEGRSALWLLDNAKSLIELVCIDSWQGGQEHIHDNMREVKERFIANIGAHPRHRLVRTLEGRSDMALMHLYATGGAEAFDWIYVDGSHRAEDVLSDLVLAWKLLAPAGVMIVDDYVWTNPESMSPFDHPKMAVDAFTTVHWPDIVPIPGAPLYQLYLVKRGLRVPPNQDQRLASTDQGRMANVSHSFIATPEERAKIEAERAQREQENARGPSTACTTPTHFKLATDAANPLEPPAVRSE